jgi:lysophospholipase L1-like esterase
MCHFSEIYWKNGSENVPEAVMHRKNFWTKVLVLTNLISLIFLVIVSLRYQVPQKVLNKLGLIHFQFSRTFPGYNINNIISLAYERENFDVVMLGDSITNLVNWNELLDNKKIANLGIGGDSTEGVLHRLDDVYLLEPKMCFIMIGINDFQGNRSVEYVAQNYRKIISEIKEHNIKVLIQSVLNIGENYYINHIAGKNKGDWEIINEKVKRLNGELEKVAKEYDVEYIDVNASLSASNILETQYGDESGVHLSLLGHKKWAEIIKPKI